MNRRERTAPKITLSVEEAADVLSVGTTYLKRLIREGKVRHIKMGRRTLLRYSDLEEYVNTLAGDVRWDEAEVTAKAPFTTGKRTRSGSRR